MATSPVLRASLTEQLVRLRGDGPLPEALLEVVVERLEVGEDLVTLVRPSDWPRLREAEHDAGRPVPYWAVAWPSGVALARVLRDRDLHGARVLELGCGLAVPSLMAAGRGAEVTATDASPDAVVFAAHNLALNDLEGGTAQADWREPGPLVEGGPWDLVLAADVLYARANVEQLLALLPRLVTDDGEVLLTDPGRTGAGEFLPIAKRQWRLISRPDDEREEVKLHRLRRR